MGGTPIQISADSEYRAESNAMLYVREKIIKGLVRCSLLSKINKNIESYAKGYERSVVEIIQSESSSGKCVSKKPTLRNLLQFH